MGRKVVKRHFHKLSLGMERLTVLASENPELVFFNNNNSNNDSDNDNDSDDDDDDGDDDNNKK